MPTNVGSTHKTEVLLDLLFEHTICYKVRPIITDHYRYALLFSIICRLPECLKALHLLLYHHVHIYLKSLPQDRSNFSIPFYFLRGGRRGQHSNSWAKLCVFQLLSMGIYGFFWKFFEKVFLIANIGTIVTFHISLMSVLFVCCRPFSPFTPFVVSSCW